MRSSDLHDLLERPDDLGGLRSAISAGMVDFRRSKEKRGTSAPVTVQIEERDLLLTEVHIRNLCEEYLGGHLDEMELDYVANALQLCPDFRFASPAIEDAVFLLGDPEINGPITPARVREILSSLPERAA